MYKHKIILLAYDKFLLELKSKDIYTERIKLRYKKYDKINKSYMIYMYYELYGW